VFWTGVDVMKLWVKLVLLGLGRGTTPVLFRDQTIESHSTPEPPRQ
jgi:hypothetical protein